MRALKELLEVVRIDLMNQQEGIVPARCGLCAVIHNLYYVDGRLTYREHKFLKKYLNNNLPPCKYGLHCWKPYTIRYRLLWVNKHIKLNA